MPDFMRPKSVWPSISFTKKVCKEGVTNLKYSLLAIKSIHCKDLSCVSHENVPVKLFSEKWQLLYKTYYISTFSL